MWRAMSRATCSSRSSQLPKEHARLAINRMLLTKDGLIAGT
jgi:hypothetical protein